ncbi:MAG: TIGR02281 family clan AA aspartic protease [Pseudomonadota bacterium]
MQNWLSLAAIVAMSVAAVPLIEGYFAEAPQPERQSVARDVSAAAPEIRSSHRRIVLDADSRGHFFVTATISGRRIKMMADTGASIIALTHRDARRIGLTPSRLDYTATMSTANGRTLAAPVMLDRVSVDGIRIHDVRAVVMQEGVLDVSLLGMSFIGALKTFELRGDRLVLEN